MKKKFIILLYFFSSLLFAKVPQRAVSTAPFSTEILLAIGAEKQMIGITKFHIKLLPELEAKAKKIKRIDFPYPTKEKFYLLKPDFLTGYETIKNEKYLGPIEELKNNGVQTYLFKSLDDDRIETFFEDILTLGKIFDLEKNSELLVEKLKKEIEELKSKIKGKKKKVITYDFGIKEPFVIGGGMGQFVIELAGCENLTKNLKEGFARTTWENLLIKKPEYILVVDYEDGSYQKKIDFLKNESPLKELDAVKKNKFISIRLSAITPGVRIVDEAKRIAKELNNIK